MIVIPDPPEPSAELLLCLSAPLPPAASCGEDVCGKNQICTLTSAGTFNCTCAPGFYGDKCEGSAPVGRGRGGGEAGGMEGGEGGDILQELWSGAAGRDRPAAFGRICAIIKN